MTKPYTFDGTIHTKGYHGALLPRDDLPRAIRIIAWAAKTHVHAKQGWEGRQGTLRHTPQEVQEAIDIVERNYGRPAIHEDNGVCCHSRVRL